MAEHEDRLVVDAFAEFHAEAVRYVRPAGTNLARRTVHRRRRTRVVMAVAALAALAVGGSATAFALAGPGRQDPPANLSESPGPTDQDIDMAVTTTNLLFPAGGTEATLTVRLATLSRAGAPYEVVINLPGGLRLLGPSGCTVHTIGQPGIQVRCPGRSMGGGGGRKIEVRLEFMSAKPIDFPTDVSVRLGEGFEDSNPANNRATFVVRYP